MLAVENPKDFNLKINYHLREEHIKPEYYQKMNVALAFQVDINININISGTKHALLQTVVVYSSLSTLVLDDESIMIAHKCMRVHECANRMIAKTIYRCDAN